MPEVGNGSKLSIIRVVQVLLRDSDCDHPLSQQEILQRMEEDYGMVVSRRSIGRNLLRLKEAGLPVKCREVPRVVNGKEAPLSLDWYWDHALTRGDLQTLVDLLYFSHLPYGDVRRLVDTLKRFQCAGYEDGKEYVWNLPLAPRFTVDETVRTRVKQALREKRQISFCYDRIGVDGKRYHRVSPVGTVKQYTASPYRVAASDGRYMLLASLEGDSGVSAFALDLMSEVAVLSAAAKPQKALDSVEAGEKLLDFLYPVDMLFTGHPELCTFEADPALMTDVVDSFGKAAVVKTAGPSRITVEVTVQPRALKAWALLHAPRVKILSPAPLVKEMREAAGGLSRLYGV